MKTIVKQHLRKGKIVKQHIRKKKKSSRRMSPSMGNVLFSKEGNLALKKELTSSKRKSSRFTKWSQIQKESDRIMNKLKRKYPEVTDTSANEHITMSVMRNSPNYED